MKNLGWKAALVLLAAVVGMARVVIFAAPPAASTMPALSTMPATSTRPAGAHASDGRLEANIALVGGKGAPARYEANEAVKVRFTVKNVSGAPLAIWARNCSWGHHVYFFEVVTESGSVVSLSEPPMTWEKNAPTPKDLAPGESFTVDLDLAKLAGWKPMPGKAWIRGVYQCKNEFKGQPDRPNLQAIWEGRLTTEPAETVFSHK